MRPDMMVPIPEFNSMSKTEQITVLCDVWECSDKKRKIHLDQYSNRRFNPHPPLGFLSWWNKDGIEQTEAATDRSWHNVDAVTAFNCEAARQEYRNFKTQGET